MQKLQLTPEKVERGTTNYKRSYNDEHYRTKHTNDMRHRTVKHVSKSKPKGGCSTDAIRKAYPYRRVYFKRHPGMICGHLWFCSQCHKPIWNKANVVVDHIVPLNKGGINHHTNCVAICNKCNLSKSDKVDYRVAKGFLSKFVESGFYLTKNAIKNITKGTFKGFLVGGKITAVTAKNLVSQGIGGVAILLLLLLIVAYSILNIII